MLTGACISRGCGFPAKARYATLACVIAAELPDLDIVYRLGGPLAYFQHHRGWTHAFWSLPLQAAFVVGVVWLWHANRKHWRKRRSRKDTAPANWMLLYGMCLLALLSHILLDWTNNYGVRPFAPFNPRWYAGDLVFIVEPLLLLVLGLALLLPLLLSLVHTEIGVHRTRYPGRGLALVALGCMAGLWLFRYAEHADALDNVTHEVSGNILKVSANPYPVNPYRWHVVLETPANFQTGSVDTRNGFFDPDTPNGIPKPATTLNTLAAKRSWLGQIYLDWARFPIVRDLGTVAEVHPETKLAPEVEALHVVRFSDLRFGYDVLGTRPSDGRSPLSAEAWVDEDRRVERIYVGDERQRLP